MLPAQEIENPCCGSQLKNHPDWQNNEADSRRQSKVQEECVWLHTCLCLCVDVIFFFFFFFYCVCLWQLQPVNPLRMWVSLSSRLSPGRPGLLAEECMGVGSFNKGNSLSGPQDGPGLSFSSSPSPVSLNPSGLLLLLLLLLRFKRNGFTLRLSEKGTEEGRSPDLKLWLTYCMPMLTGLGTGSHDILLEHSVVLPAIQQVTLDHI